MLWLQYWYIFLVQTPRRRCWCLQRLSRQSDKRYRFILYEMVVIWTCSVSLMSMCFLFKIPGKQFFFFHMVPTGEYQEHDYFPLTFLIRCCLPGTGWRGRKKSFSPSFLMVSVLLAARCNHWCPEAWEPWEPSSSDNGAVVPKARLPGEPRHIRFPQSQEPGNIITQHRNNHSLINVASSNTSAQTD